METHNRERGWERWTGSIADVHDLVQTAADATGEHVPEGATGAHVDLTLSDRQVDFYSAEQFARGFGVDELQNLKSLTISVGDMTASPTVTVFILIPAPGYAASLAVGGTSRAAVDAVLARLEEKMQAGRRRPNVAAHKLHRAATAAGAVIGLLVGAGVMALAGVFSSSWWVIVLSAAGAVALAAGAAVVARRTARRLAPSLELVPPGEQTAWQRFRTSSLRSSERLLWLGVGAGLTILVNLLT